MVGAVMMIAAEPTMGANAKAARKPNAPRARAMRREMADISNPEVEVLRGESVCLPRGPLANLLIPPAERVMLVQIIAGFTGAVVVLGFGPQHSQVVERFGVGFGHG